MKIGRQVKAAVIGLQIVALSVFSPLAMTYVTALADSPATYTYSGILTDQNGNPIPGYDIELENSAGQAASSITDSTGAFSVIAPAASGYTVSVEPNEASGSITTVGDNSLDSTSVGPISGDSIDLSSGNVTQNIALNLVTVTVTVENSSGNPQSGDSVSASGGGTTSVTAGGTSYSSVSIGQASLGGQTGSDGTITELVPQGTIFPAGKLCVSFADGTGTCSTSAITASQNISQTFQEGPTNTYSGILTDQNGNPIPDFTVQLENSAGEYASSITDSTGAFNIIAQAASGYTASVALLPPSESNVSVGGNLLGLTAVGPVSANSIDLSDSNVTQNISLNLVTVAITVEDSSGNPQSSDNVSGDGLDTGGTTSVSVGGTSYSPVAIGQATLAGQTASDGTFTELVPQGAIFPAGKLCVSFADGTSTCSTSAITASQNISQTFQEGSTYTYSGILTDQNGNPIPGYDIELENSAGQAASSITDSTGAFSVIAPAASGYTVSVEPNEASGSITTVGDNSLDSTSVGPISGDSIDLSSGNVTQNIALNLVTVTVTVENSSGNPQSGDSVSASGGGTTSVTAGGTSYSSVSIGQASLGGQTGSDGTITELVPQGTIFPAGKLCVSFADGTGTCSTSAITASQNTNETFEEGAVPVAPTGLSAASPTANYPSLNWSPVSGAASYNIYQNGNLVGNTTSTSFVDSSVLTSGSYSYTVTAVSAEGVEGPASTPFTVVYDITSPTVSNLELSPTTIAAGKSATLTASVSDSFSGILAAEYFVGADPGQGNGIPMQLIHGTAKATGVGSTLSNGVYTIGVRAENGAGVWSTPVTVQLTVQVAAPAHLMATSPTSQFPELSWGPVSGASSYDVYQNGNLVGNTTSTSFTDGSVLSSGSYKYTVAAVVNGGPGPTSAPFTVVYDTAAPTVSNAKLSPNTITVGGSSSLSATLTPGLSGVHAAEYFIGSDPGQGKGTPMTIGNGNATASVGSSLTPGTYTVSVRAESGAGVWSSPVTAQLNVQLPAPSGLTASTPTNQYPSLSWNSVSGAASYNVYQNGNLVGNTTSTSFTDSSVITTGSYAYMVAAVSTSGVKGPASSPFTVVYDITPPTITYALSPAANSAGWNNSPVTVTFTCTDSGTGVGIASCPSPVTVSSNTSGQTVAGTATDNAGNSASTSVVVKLDQASPAVGSYGPFTKAVGASFALTAPASDSLSGVAGGEYFVGTTDPGQGNGIPMTYDNGTLMAMSGDNTLTNLPAGTYQLNVRAESVAGVWSAVTTSTLTVINPAITVGAITAPATTGEGDSINASATFTDPESETDTASWNWGDGDTTAGTVSGDNVTGSHTYSKAGSYVIVLTVTGADGQSGSSQFVVAVSPTSTFKGANLSGLDFSEANFAGVDMAGDNLQDATLNDTNFAGADLAGDNGSGASFEDADFAGADLAGNNFQNADLSGANLTNADLAGANLTGANLTNANLTGANLKGANFKNATMTGVTYSDTTCPNNTNSNNDGDTCKGQGGGL